MDNKKTVGILLLVVLFLAGVAGGYIYFSKVIPRENSSITEGGAGTSSRTEDMFSLRIYYPAGNELKIEERKIPRSNAQTAIAAATVEEYLKGPAGSAISYMPGDTKLVGLYRGADRILYVDLSDEFRRNFQGDVFAEFLLLKGLYESLVSNVEDVQDVKILIEGKEVETLGGHLYLLYPLKDTVSYEHP
jgi:spore germination protein GerM